MGNSAPVQNKNLRPNKSIQQDPEEEKMKEKEKIMNELLKEGDLDQLKKLNLDKSDARLFLDKTLKSLTPHFSFVDYLLSLHPDINSKDKLKKTSLHYAVGNPKVNKQMVEKLIHFKADINSIDINLWYLIFKKNFIK